MKTSMSYRRNPAKCYYMIVHNYGHAGKGLAFSIGCAKDSLSLIEMCLTEMNFKELQ